MLSYTLLTAAWATCPDVAAWPAGEWPEARARADVEAVAALEAYAFPPGASGSDGERAGVRTDGVVILQGGAILYERYARGYGVDSPHLLWSVTKSYTNALAGIAVARGALNLSHSICDYVRSPRVDSCAITPRDLLAFSSGLDWAETYEGEPPTASSVVAMLYGEGAVDMAAFTAGHPMRDSAGTTYAYSSGDTNLLAAVIGAAMEPDYGRGYPWDLLFEPLGMGAVTWERDGAGTLVGSSYLYMTPRDMARFGWFLRADGCVGDQRILPEGWVAWSTEVTDAIRREAIGREDGDVQGRQLWLNQPVPEAGQDERPWPSAPEDTYAARGHWKQSIAVVPSRDMVIVRTADDRDGSFDYDRFLGLALAMGEGAP